jgi:NADPH:quinone reductase-like Zn-dependent oxidoreductase
MSSATDEKKAASAAVVVVDEKKAAAAPVAPADIKSDQKISISAATATAVAAGAVHPLDAVAGDGKRVLVTGAGGYIAGFIIALLQARGYRVRGTVRNVKKTADVAHLKLLTPKDAKYPDVELVEADLLEPKGWPAAVADCHYVIHCASPFVVEVPKDENVLIKPAVDGTLNVLRALALSKRMRS